MKFYRSILSLLLLSAYTLLLLHDFIPHSHYYQHTEVQIATAIHHSHDDHHHSHEHQKEGEKNNRSSDSPDKDTIVDQLIHSHSHYGNDGYPHEMAYRTAKDDLITPVDARQHFLTDFLKVPDRLDHNNSWQFRFLPSLSNPYLSSGHGLRAPPVLG